MRLLSSSSVVYFIEFQISSYVVKIRRSKVRDHKKNDTAALDQLLNDFMKISRIIKNASSFL